MDSKFKHLHNAHKDLHVYSLKLRPAGESGEGGKGVEGRIQVELYLNWVDPHLQAKE